MRKLELANPFLVFCSVWGFVLFLYMLGATKNLVPISFIGVFLVALNMLSMALLYMFLVGARRFSETTKSDVFKHIDSAKIYFRTLLLLWFVGTCFEIYIQRGFPLYWNFVGDGRLYTDFGIPSFHGVMNAMYLQAVTALAYVYFGKPKKVYIVIMLLLFFWPVMMLGRGILLSAIIQLVAVFLLTRKLTLRAVLVVALSALLSIFLFGYVGDLRQTENPFFYLVKADYIDFFSALPSGFLWFYVYLTSGMSNLFYNIDIIEPVYTFGYSFYNMLPSAVKIWMGIEGRNDLFVFVDNNLNAATFYSGYISDFGVFGAFFLAAFVQFCCCYAYALAKRGRPWGVFAYAVVFQILIFSIFYDLFFILPVLFQFVLVFFYYCACQLRLPVVLEKRE